MVVYSSGIPKKTYIEPVAVGDVLRDMPVFLDAATYTLVPLESTYNTTWDSCPEPLREHVQNTPRSPAAPPSSNT
jgi:hypothetical protein